MFPGSLESTHFGGWWWEQMYPVMPTISADGTYKVQEKSNIRKIELIPYVYMMRWYFTEHFQSESPMISVIKWMEYRWEKRASEISRNLLKATQVVRVSSGMETSHMTTESTFLPHSNSSQTNLFITQCLRKCLRLKVLTINVLISCGRWLSLSPQSCHNCVLRDVDSWSRDLADEDVKLRDCPKSRLDPTLWFGIHVSRLPAEYSSQDSLFHLKAPYFYEGDSHNSLV